MKKKALALTLSLLMAVSVFATVFAGTVSAAGSSFNNATRISSNSEVSGTIQTQSDEDYYRVTTDSDGVIRLSFRKDYSNEGVGWRVIQF